MNNNVFCFVIILYLSFIKINNSFDIPSEKVEMIITNEKLIYTYDQISTIIMRDIKTNNEVSVNNNVITTNKYLIRLSEISFILFGLNSNSEFRYNKYSISSNGIVSLSGGSFGSIFSLQNNYIIREVDENIYILSYKIDNNYYVYRLNLEETPNNLKLFEGNERGLNTFECDSYDGNNIFCVYSTANYNYNIDEYEMNCYYIFRNINNLSNDRYGFKLGSNDPLAISLLKVKIDEDKKFIICSAETYQVEDTFNNIIYCQYFQVQNNKLYLGNIYKILEMNGKSFMENSYLNNNPLILKRYKYSIYIFIEITMSGTNNVPALITSSLDFSMIIPANVDLTPIKGNQNILINEDYYILLKNNLDNSGTIVELNSFIARCIENETYQFNSKGEMKSTNIYQNLVQDSYRDDTNYLSFSLDILTILNVNNERNIGGLLNMRRVKMITNIELIYNEILDYSQNYYIYHSRLLVDNYKINSNFCYFKVINCYESCNKCNPNKKGTKESHQCESCLTDYYEYITDLNEAGYYNCYKSDDQKILEGVYLGTDGRYHNCDNSCKTCSDAITCNKCKDGYYFKEEKVLNNKLTDICYNSTPEFYYLNSTSNINVNGIIYQFSYKKCYDTCSTCLGDGNEKNNNCIECRNGLTNNYPFDRTKCTIDKDQCTSNLWEINQDNNNIECIDSCPYYLIYEGNNKNQCVRDCQDYINPYETKQSKTLILYSCDDYTLSKSYKYCITSTLCSSKKLNYDEKQCYPPFTGCVNLTEYNPSQGDPTIEQSNVTKRVRLIKSYEYIHEYDEVINNFVLNQSLKYNEELNNELRHNSYLNGLDFITFSKYKDFILTIYPLNAEDYVINNLLKSNNLSFVNFTKFFNGINYQYNKENETILIGLIEYINANVPINSINYFFIIFNEQTKGLKSQIPTQELQNKYSSFPLNIEVSYPLYNFQNSNVNNARYSTNLIATIKNMSSLDKNLNLYDKDDKFFNSICYTYKSDVNTDMAIEDRINEYYIDISLCENNCSLSNIYDKEENQNPRALCICQLNNDFKITNKSYSFNSQQIKAKKIGNTRALSCAKEVFSSKKVNSNFIFWIFIIFFFGIIILMLFILISGDEILENMIKIKPNKITDQNKEIYNDFQKDKIDNNFKKEKYKSVRAIEDLKSSFRNVKDYKKQVFKTSPKRRENSESAPPKKMKKISSKINDEEDKKNEYILPTTNNNNDAIYFEDLYDEKNKDEYFNNYLINNKNFLKNNYLEYRRRKIFQNARLSLKPIDENDLKELGIKYNANDRDYIPYRDYGKYKNIFFRKKKNSFDKLQKNRYLYDDVFKIKNNFYYRTQPNNIDLSRNSKISNFMFNEQSEFFGDELPMSGTNYNNINENNINDDYNDNENNIDNDESKQNSDDNSRFKDNDYNNNILRLNNKKYANDILENSKDISSENKKVKLKKNRKLNNNYRTEYFDSKRNLDSSNDSKTRNRRKFAKTSLISNNSSIRIMNKSNISNDTNLDDANKNKIDNLQNNDFNIKKNLYNNKIFLSSLTEYENSNENYKTFKSFCKNYWNYLIKREIFFATFYNKNNNLAIFIRIPTLFLVISFIFTINCLFLTRSSIHKRYLFAKENNGIKEFKYVFGHEFLKCFLAALVSIIFKMIIVKVVYGYIFFRIRINTKIDFSNTNAEEEIMVKKKQFFTKYKNQSLIYIAIVAVLMILLGYISVCYVGTFPNTKGGIILGFFISLVLSFIFCCIICFIIIIFYQIGKICGFLLCHSIYEVMEIIY